MDSALVARLRDHVAELQSLRARWADPAVHGDPAELKRIGQRIAALEPEEPLLTEWERLERSLSAEAGLDDPELQAIAAAEAEAARAALPELEERIRAALIPRDEDDGRDVIVEVRAGAGGDEASLFASELIRMYIRYAESQGWKASLADLSPSESGGAKEGVLRIAGRGAYGRLKFESG
ncbi:MAG: PCRF domain-containing protein, partial [Candidatus Peribacteraceae bacterium]|nr:PCRF domain-containing protein [Candidatus Peribacteraceae bacterium]